MYKEAAERLMKFYGITLRIQLEQDEMPIVEKFKELRHSDINRLKTGFAFLFYFDAL